MTEEVKHEWVRLLDDRHTHAGEPVPKGATIKMRADQAAKLCDCKPPRAERTTEPKGAK